MVKTKRKDIVHYLDQDTVNKILDIAGEGVDFYEGCLLDNCIIWYAENIKINRTSRNHIILKEHYLNEWSSTTQLIMTDDEEKVDKYKDMFEPDLKD